MTIGNKNVDQIGELDLLEMIDAGNHPENDTAGAVDVGLRTAFLKRGPWVIAYILSAAARRADIVLENLSDLPLMPLLGRD